MRYFKSSHLGVAGLFALALLLSLAPQLGWQTATSTVLIHRNSDSPLLPLLGVFKSAPRFVLRKG